MSVDQGTAAESKELEGQPTPPVSGDEGVKPSSVDQGTELSDDFVSRLLEHPQVQKALRAGQADKDRRLKVVDELQEAGAVDILTGIKPYLQKYEGDPDEAVRQYRIDQLLEQGQAPSGVEAPRASRGKEPEVSFESQIGTVLTKAGLEGEAATAVRKAWVEEAPKGGYDTESEALADLAAIVIRHGSAQAKRNGPASPAGIAPPVGAAPQASQDGQAWYKQEREKRLKGVHGGTQRARVLTDLKIEANKKFPDLKIT